MQCPAPALQPAAPPGLPCPCRHRQQVITSLGALSLPQHTFAIIFWKATLRTYCGVSGMAAWICVHDMGFKVSAPVCQHHGYCRHITSWYVSRLPDCSLC